MPSLRELHARFVSRYDPTKGSFHEQGELRAGAQGLLFECPLPTCDHSVLVWFRDSNVPPEARPSPRWVVQGDSLDNLTLAPSINLDVPWVDDKGVSHASSCKWHGFINGGVAK